MNGLSLFTGSGIGELVLKEIIPSYRTVCYVEWDKFCQRLIKRRIEDGWLDDAPIWDDVRSFDGRPWAGRVDLLSGGFPCQPFSVAGKRKAESDERNMWPDTFRLIGEIRPRYALLENVPGLLAHGYIRRVFADLASIGYDCEWDIVGASDVGGWHRRKRIWILAYNDGNGIQGCWNGGNTRTIRSWWPDRQENMQMVYERTACTDAGLPEPLIWGVAHGVAGRVDRLKCLGNGWVPQVVARILRIGG